MFNPLAAKLSSFTDLADGDVAALDALLGAPVTGHAHSDVIREGDRPEQVILLLRGWACRYKVLENGSRQIVAYLVPGDLCDPHVFILDVMDHSIGLLTDATLAFISREAIIRLTDCCPKIARALWWSTLVDEAVLRHWLVNLGQRDAFDRVAHLFCELWDRMRQVCLDAGDALEVPLTQEQLGDTMALTTVHTNRVIQRMRTEGLISVTRKMIRVHDIERLRAMCGYDPTYLHLRRRA